MKWKAVSGMMLTLLLVSMLTLAFSIQQVKASGTIYIRADGSVEGTTDISTVDNVTYIFTNDIYDEIVVERSNITIDGAGYKLQGGGSGNGIDLYNMLNVTITNLEIKAFQCGIHVHNSSKNTIYGNTITDNADSGIYIDHYSNNNNISGNTMTTNPTGMRVHESFDNKILGNNITNNNCAIVLYYSNYTIISGNSITENLDDVCIELGWASYNAFSGNNISNNYGNIGLQDSFNNTFSGNNISSNGGGIDLYESSNNIVSGNNITENDEYGIKVQFSSNNTIFGNNITNNYDGIVLAGGSSNNTISGNNIANSDYYGFFLRESSCNNVLRNNSMVDNRYNFGAGFPHSLVDNDVDVSNTVDGKPIYYLVNQQNLEVPSDAGYVALLNSYNITVKELELKNNVEGLFVRNTTNSRIQNCKITNNSVGILLWTYSNNNTISENNITRNNWRGVDLDSSSYNDLSGNNITSNNDCGIVADESSFNSICGNYLSNNSYGVLLGWSSNYNYISRNIISNNTVGVDLYGTYGLHSNTVSENLVTRNTYGVQSNAEDNKIYHNNFIDNTNQVGYVQANLWDDAYPSGGNYWNDYVGVDEKSGQNQDQPGSDGIGDTPYVFNLNNRDRYPLMTPWPSGPGLHELEVTLKAPTRLPPGNSTLLEATVRNSGFSNEENVTFFLFLNNTIINSTAIPLLEADSFCTISYFWTPAIEGWANITAYATPVPGEILVENNRKTVFITISTNPPVRNIDTELYCDTIQEAVDAPETIDGHTIEADAGIYYERLTIDKSLKIIGRDRTNTIIDGNKTGTFVVHITASNVVLSGFTIQNSNAAPTPAIRIDSSNNVISNNTIVNNGWGIYAFSVSNNTIENNTITNNVYGVYLEWATTHTVKNNTITNHQQAGIYLRESRNNIFTNNVIENNKDGIVLISDSNNNKFYHNNFIDNTSPGFAVNSDNNILDDGYPYGGNYWSDYPGVDVYSGPCQNETGSDGIGDAPYTFSWPNQDNYPLMNPIGTPQPPIANFAYSPEHPGINGTVSFNASASYDRDGFIASYVWDFGDGNITIVADPIITHLYTAPSTYTVNLTVIDNDGFTHSVIKSITIEKISSTITVNVDPTIATVGLNVTINGTITPIRIDANVTISYRLSGETWSTLATVKTDSSSHYTYTWKTTNEGIYEIKASWQGDENTLPGESETKTVIVDSTPPITLHDYDGLWHTTDFTITLTATDNLSDVAETYYKINDGPTKTVSADGQPQITTESANNTLEYWSVDNAGNEEHPHNILTGIKLDKTVPIIGIPSRIPEGYVQPNQIVKVSVNVTDLTSDVKSVRLAYFIDNSTIGIEFPMTFNSTTGLYVTSFGIPGQQANTLVRYAIAAYDNAGNHIIDDNIGQYYVYTVIPEFPTWTSMLLILIMLTVAIAIHKRRLLKTPIH